MPTPFFTAHPEQIAALHAEVARWAGTPFRARSAACGLRGGVDCVRLANHLLHAAGAVPLVEFPRYAIDTGNHADSSPLLEFLRGRAPSADSARIGRCLQEFDRTEPTQAGDVLVMRVGRVEYHLGVATTDEGDFCHVLIRRAVTVATLRDSTFADALQAVFRPVVPDQTEAGL